MIHMHIYFNITVCLYSHVREDVHKYIIYIYIQKRTHTYIYNYRNRYIHVITDDMKCSIMKYEGYHIYTRMCSDHR